MLLKIVNQVHVDPVADEREDGGPQEPAPLPGHAFLVVAVISPLGRKERVFTQADRDLGVRSDGPLVISTYVDAHVASADESGGFAQRVAVLVKVLGFPSVHRVQD